MRTPLKLNIQSRQYDSFLVLLYQHKLQLGTTIETTSVNNKGQVTIPKEVRKRLGIPKGSKLGFSVLGDHIERHLLDQQPAETSVSGFEMLKSSRHAVPADFDPATLPGGSNFFGGGFN